MKIKKIFNFIVQYCYAVISCLFLFSFGLLYAKNRALLYGICRHFGYAKASMDTAVIPKISLSEILPKNISFYLNDPNLIPGSITFLQTLVLIELIKRTKPHTVFEIGTNDGNTALNIAANTNDEVKVFTLDLPRANRASTKLRILPVDDIFIDKDEIGLRYRGSVFEKRITQLYGDSATFDFTPYDSLMDFIFVDGSHSYEYVMNDSKRALALMRSPQSIIVWHDYGTPGTGVARALNKLYRTDENFKGLKHIDGTCLICLGL